MTEVTISFPGIGIGEFTVDKVAFTVGKFDIRWYAIILTLGIVAGVLYTLYRSKHEGIPSEDVLDFTLCTVPLAIIGARVYYVLTTLKDASGKWNYTSFKDVIAIWEGGIAIYGAIIGGALGVFIVSRFKKYNKNRLLKMTDMVAPGVMLGQIIGRWGNFVNGEAHGVETAETFFLRMGLMGAADCKYPNKITYYHPTFLYESLWNLLGFILINALYKKKKFDGQVLLMYLAWYGFGRMFIEGLRTDSLYIGVFRISQVVGFLCFAICSSLLVYLWVRAKRQEMDDVAYESVYERSHSFSIIRTKEEAQDTPEEENNIVEEQEENENDEFD